MEEKDYKNENHINPEDPIPEANYEEEPAREEAYEEEPAAPRPRKKKKGGLILLLILLILTAAGSAGWYLYQRNQPKEAVEQYLTAVQNLDFDAMQTFLQSNDLSALDDADLRTEAYAEYFRAINKQMTFKIVKNRFHINTGTAQVTARIRYVDGTDIYKEAVNEFLRQLLTRVLAGETVDEAEIQQSLAALLTEKTNSVTPSYKETEIVYPVIRTGDTWKIVSLDEETVSLMSADFKSVEEEINQTLDASEEQSSTENENTSSEETADGKIDMTTQNFQICYTGHLVVKDYAGASCLLVYYDYTNLNTSASSAMVDVSLSAYQNGNALEPAIPETNDEALDRYMEEVQPQETVNVCQAFSLEDTSEVTLRAAEGLSLGEGTSTSQVLTLQ